METETGGHASVGIDVIHWTDRIAVEEAPTAKNRLDPIYKRME